MSYGLRVWNAAGTLTLDITDRLTRVHGVFPFTTPATSTASVFVTVPGYTNDGTWAFFVTHNGVKVSVSGSVFQITSFGEAISAQIVVFRY